MHALLSLLTVESVAPNFDILNGLSLVFGHFQTDQLSAGSLSETEPTKFILKSQESMARLAIPHNESF